MAKLKAKYGKPNAERRIPKAECGKPNAESGIRKTKYGKLNTENLIRRVLKSTTCEFQNAELLKPQTKPQTKKHTFKLYKTQFRHRKSTKKV